MFSIFPFRARRCLPSTGSTCTDVFRSLAAFLTGQKDAYDYLGASIEKFPSGDLMLRLIESNGFANANAQDDDERRRHNLHRAETVVAALLRPKITAKRLGNPLPMEQEREWVSP